MSTEYTQIRSEGAATTVARPRSDIGLLRSAVTVAGSLTLAALAIPALVIGAAVTLLVLVWPVFLGAYLTYGYVPGTAFRGQMVLGAEWWLLTLGWLGVLLVAAVASLAVRSERSLTGFLRSPRAPGRARRPRPRI